jgi:short-subunit dehydrogenase
MSVYAASKWGIEGFYEGTIPEIAGFGIKMTLVEPGAWHTNFGSSSAAFGQPMAVYEQTAVGDFRRMAATAGVAMFRGEPNRAVVIPSGVFHRGALCIAAALAVLTMTKPSGSVT